MKTKSTIKSVAQHATCLAVVFLMPLCTAGSVWAKDAQKGLQIMQAQDKKDAGWRSVRVNGEMVLVTKSGNVSRKFELARTERQSKSRGDNSRMLFSTPTDVKGTVLLTHGNVEPKDDSQWLYLPSTGKARRISSSNRSGKFLSSEFSFEDMGGSELEDNTYAWLKDEACPGNAKSTCHVVAAYPKNRKSGYSQRILWLDSKEYRVYQTEYYNRRNKMIKRMKNSGFRKYSGHWRPSTLDMTNLQTGARTLLKWSNFAFGASVDSATMSPQRLGK